MAITRQISGWKFESLEKVASVEAECQKYFNIPRKVEGQITTRCIGEIPQYNTKGSIDFYYIGYDSQFETILGEPALFEITYLDEEDELQK